MPSFLVKPWVYWTAGPGLVAIIAWLLRLYVKKTVDHQFALRIESHKSELQMMVEQERFALQRKLAATGLYLEKQHAGAAEIYRAVRVAHGAVAGLFGAQASWNFDNCNQQDLERILEKFDVLEGKKEELITTWESDRAEGVDAIKQYLFSLRIPRAESKLQEARNLMYLNEIYFSDATIRAFDAFVRKCLEWIMRATFPPEPGERIKMVSRAELNASLETVQSTLGSELSDPPAIQIPAARLPKHKTAP